MKKRITALLMALILCLGMLTACGSDTAEDTTVEDDTTAEAEGVTIDPDAAYAQYDPNTVVMTVNGSEVTWSELFYRLYSVVYQLEYYGGGTIVWEDPCLFDSSYTNAEYAMYVAVDGCIQYHMLEKQFKDMNITLTAEDEATLAELLATDMEGLCGENATEEDFNAVLEELYLTRETYDYMNTMGVLYERAYQEIAGFNGENLDESEIQECIDAYGFRTNKHILLMTTDAEGLTLSDEEIAAQKQTAEEILAALRAVEGDKDALVKLFDEKMFEYSEDTGLAYYPDGYTFGPGEMVAEFEAESDTLGDYQVSDIVETSYGYHILLGLPTTRDSLVEYVDGIDDYTVGSYAAARVMGSLMSAWYEEAEIVWEDNFETMTAEMIFS